MAQGKTSDSRSFLRILTLSVSIVVHSTGAASLVRHAGIGSVPKVVRTTWGKAVLQIHRYMQIVSIGILESDGVHILALARVAIRGSNHCFGGSGPRSLWHWGSGGEEW